MAQRFVILAVIAALAAAGCGAGPGFRRNVQGLESGNPDVRRESALGLGHTKLRNARLRDATITRLAVMAEMDADPLTRSAALMALSLQNPGKAVETAKLLRSDQSPTVRADAAKIMRMHGDASCVGPLIAMLKEERNVKVRRETVKALGRFREPDAVVVLIERLGDPDRSVAHAARESLVRVSGRDFSMDRSAWRNWHRDLIRTPE